MEIHPIRTDNDHHEALAEIEKLWGTSGGTPEGDKLDVLVTLVGTYEERRWPVRSRRRFNPVDVLHYAIGSSVIAKLSSQIFLARIRARPKF